MIDPGPVLPEDVISRARAEGSLESPWVWVILGIVALAAGFAVYRYWKQRTRRNVAIGGVLSFALLAGLAGLNSYVGYVRTPHDLGMLIARGPAILAPIGRMVADVARDTAQDDPRAGGSKALKRARAVASADDELRVRRIELPNVGMRSGKGMTNVLLPPGYDDPANAGKRYPVVYLLHGYPAGSSDDWFTAGDAVGTMRQLFSHHLVPPMIVVAPDMSAGEPATDWECLDVPGGPRLENYLTGFVVPQIDGKFRTMADREHRAIGGMSGGAFCALNLSLRHLGQFSTNLMTLPYDTPGTSAALLGRNQALIAANCPRTYLPKMTFTQPLASMIDVGMGAPADVRTGKRIARALAQRGQHVALRKEPGMNHTWNTARVALPFLMAFAGKQFAPRQLEQKPPQTGNIAPPSGQPKPPPPPLPRVSR